MVAAAPPPSPPAIVRRWSRALNANDNQAAAALFAPRARVVQPCVAVGLTPQLAVAFNASLPCAGKITRIQRHGSRGVATFVLGEGPGHRCTGAGGKAAALFVVENGLIVLWQEVPVPSDKPTA